MKARTVARIEFGIEAVAAAAMAAALGNAVTVFVTGFYPYPVVRGMAAAAIAFTGIREALKRLAHPVLRAAKVKSAPFPALSLADFSAVGAPVAGIAGGFPAEQPLFLDDPLTDPAAATRVVQLFDRDGQPAAEEGRDDSEALFDALGKLRGTLR